MMMKTGDWSRRSFLGAAVCLPAAAWLPLPALEALAGKKIPVGLELYSVRESLKKDPQGTVRAVGEMGYECVEFYAPYFDWSESETKDMRKLLDDLHVRCYSTHNSAAYFAPESLPRLLERNQILGASYAVMASSAPIEDAAGWKNVADVLNRSAEQLEPKGLKVGYHNHQVEFQPRDGVHPIEILAQRTKPSVMLQLDVGTCLEAGSDPVKWIQTNPGRIHSLHLKDWSPKDGYGVAWGQGAADWKAIFAAAESVGGVEFYLIEQEVVHASELEDAKACLSSFHKIRGS
jgi:sugar phosphate isomerase/epimerase